MPVKTSVVDLNGNFVRDLGDFPAVAVDLIQKQQTLRFDTDGPVFILFGNGITRIEQNSPFFLYGDANNKPVAPPADQPLGTFRVKVVAGPRYDVTDFTVNVIAPPPPPRPVLPTRTIRVAPANGKRGEGFDLKRPGSYVNLEARNFEENFSIPNGVKGKYILRNFRSLTPWRDLRDQVNEGSGFYMGDGGCDVELYDYYSREAGWNPKMTGPQKTDRTHGVYKNVGGSLLMEDFVITRPASVGVQGRCPTILRRGFIHRAAIAFLSIYGPFYAEDVTVYGSTYQWPVGGANLNGRMGLSAYAPTTLKDVWFVGSVVDDILPFPLPTGVKTYSNGAINRSRSHRQYPDTPGGSVTMQDCRIVGWPGDDKGETYTGDMPANTLTYVGTNVQSHQPVDAENEVNEILKALDNYELLPKDAVPLLKRAVRSKC